MHATNMRSKIMSILRQWKTMGSIGLRLVRSSMRSICDSTVPHIPYERRKNMKRADLWMARVALSLSVGLLTVAQGYAGEKANMPTCTQATLRGRYLFGGIATLLPPAVTQQSLLAVAGYHIFNGDGTGTDIVTASINGAIVEDNNSFPINYTVNPDCTGTYTVPSEGLTFDIFIAPSGEELIVIGTKPGFVLVQGPSRRVSEK